MVGVHVPAVSIQYLVVATHALESVGLNVTEKSVFLQLLLALSVVAGTELSTFSRIHLSLYPFPFHTRSY